MTAEAFATLLHAKRVKRGRWIAKCPSHVDRAPSLSIAEGKKRPIVFKCMSQGCSPDSILEAMGISWGDVLGGSPITPEIRQKLRDQERLKLLEARWLSYSMNIVWDSANRNYWRRAAQGIDEEIVALASKLDPPNQRENKMKAAIAKHGWSAIWTKFLETEKGQALSARYSIECATSTSPSAPRIASVAGLLSW